jgi:hypothetical protein
MWWVSQDEGIFVCMGFGMILPRNEGFCMVYIAKWNKINKKPSNSHLLLV